MQRLRECGCWLGSQPQSILPLQQTCCWCARESAILGQERTGEPITSAHPSFGIHIAKQVKIKKNLWAESGQIINSGHSPLFEVCQPPSHPTHHPPSTVSCISTLLSSFFFSLPHSRHSLSLGLFTFLFFFNFRNLIERHTSSSIRLIPNLV